MILPCKKNTCLNVSHCLDLPCPWRLPVSGESHPRCPGALSSPFQHQVFPLGWEDLWHLVILPRFPLCPCFSCYIWLQVRSLSVCLLTPDSIKVLLSDFQINIYRMSFLCCKGSHLETSYFYLAALLSHLWISTEMRLFSRRRGSSVLIP